MDAKNYLLKNGRDKAKQVAESAGTTIDYFNQLASGNRRPSVKLANQLVKCSDGEMDFVSLLNSTQQQEAA